MLNFDITLDNSPCVVRVVETPHDRTAFLDWIEDQPLVAVDTETSGLDIYSTGFQCYMVQYGNGSESWVLPNIPDNRSAIHTGLDYPRHLVMHNATFDMLVIDAHVKWPLEQMVGKTFDTSILAHLLDPRAAGEGGTGRKLKDLARIWVDPEAPDSEALLHARFRELKANKNTGWKVIDRNDPVLLKYAGVDTILTFRLFGVLKELCKNAGLSRLVEFEHHLQGILASMQRKGIRLDVPYTQTLRDRLTIEAEHFAGVAAQYGVTKINSPAQVVAALTAMGETFTETTASGAPKADKEVLMPFADLDRDWNLIGARTPNPLADAVLRGKRAAKWAESYAQAFLDLRDPLDRIHPSINGLQARTARMSVSRPPLQQLPSSDWMIRRALIADPGMTLIALDYSQVEMRILAGVSGDQTMIEAILSGTDLHDFTAEKLYGPDFTSKQRKIAKGVGFGKVYGGGAKTLSRQTGADMDAVKNAIAAYDRAFIGIARYSRRLQSAAQYGRKEVVTPTGRHLPLDRDRLYAATNYVVQSTARDVLAQAIVNMHAAGLGDYFLLPVHDEIIAQTPIADADDVLHAMREVMESAPFMGIPMRADGEILGPSWGHGYGAPE